MLHRFEQCPGPESVESAIVGYFEDCDPEELIRVQTRYTRKQAATHKRIYSRSCYQNLKFIMPSLHSKTSNQATLHPFVAYFCKNKEVQFTNFCVISDSLRHDTMTVHIIKGLIKYLKTKFAQIHHIHYFSDCSSAQYKNFKNFLNLCHHKKDFGITADWNFFTTSHGNKEQIEQEKVLQEERFPHGNTLAGTRENHHFVHICETTIRKRRVSNDRTSFLTKI
ncbi:hypothetical protein PR048_015917 [Dryococelus australis]|uniref:Uncharacterized protein n=1 Tax=Dryococelus australis TaxID=614101 RepID=A0ABQ9HIG3_9NEOP|nr:hypothetical protein PR048_015917 [Dryococelus australis]